MLDLQQHSWQRVEASPLPEARGVVQSDFHHASGHLWLSQYGLVDSVHCGETTVPFPAGKSAFLQVYQVHMRSPTDGVVSFTPVILYGANLLASTVLDRVTLQGVGQHVCNQTGFVLGSAGSLLPNMVLESGSSGEGGARRSSC